MQLNYSFVIPVYNRPQEIMELLQSMTHLDFPRKFEVVIVEDGSSIPADKVIAQFDDLLDITYFQKVNSGPGDSRNYGMERAAGDYFLILDSDVILPSNYLKEVDSFLSMQYFDFFGGPDGAHNDFSNLQKAINYSMTSIFTTGGIRGNKKAIGKFQPRSFNMGISKKAFEASGGFGTIHPGEDPDLSLRLWSLNFKSAFIPNAVVFHKRRISWEKFYQQVNKFGKARPILNSWHPRSSRITYWFPSLFLAGLAIGMVLSLFGNPYILVFYLVYMLIIGLDAAVKNKSFNIGIAAMRATLVQFWGYGSGFLASVWKINILKQVPENAFPELFFHDITKKQNKNPLDQERPS